MTEALGSWDTTMGVCLQLSELDNRGNSSGRTFAGLHFLELDLELLLSDWLNKGMTVVL